MISEIGNLLLSISTSLSLCMFSVVFLRKTINIDLRYIICKNLSFFILFFTFLSFVFLSYAFLIDDFSLRYVANNSNISLYLLVNFFWTLSGIPF